MKINCLPLSVTEYVDHCICCDNIVPFDWNGHCWICGSDMPFGSIDDEELTQEMFEYENRVSKFTIMPKDTPLIKSRYGKEA